MNIGMSLEIHFHQQDEASIYLESNTSGEDEMFGEILLFCCVALRQMVNFGINHPTSSALAMLLTQISNSIVQIANYENPNTPKLVDYKGSPGRKRFVASLGYINGKLNFQFNAKGFGLLAREMEYYAPNSVLVLLRYLVKKRINDRDFISRLSRSVENCGKAYYSGQLSVLTQHQIALMIADETLKKILQKAHEKLKEELSNICEDAIFAVKNDTSLPQGQRFAK